MQVTLEIKKSVEENASVYFEKAKKLKKKIKGAEEALIESKKKLDAIKKEQVKISEKEKVVVADRKKEWYEKFRWFFSSNGMLCIGGRDATSNEIIVKKHMAEEDIVFHTDMAGSPFFVIKTEGNEVSDTVLEEVGQAVAVYSRAWKLGLTTTNVFYVEPSQVSKEAQSGEFMAKGSFMIRGKTNYLHPKLEMAIGIKEEIIIGGPVSAIKKNSEKFCIIVQGREKASNTAKKVKKKLGSGELDDIIRFLPAGGTKLLK